MMASIQYQLPPHPLWKSSLQLLSGPQAYQPPQFGGQQINSHYLFVAARQNNWNLTRENKSQLQILMRPNIIKNLIKQLLSQKFFCFINYSWGKIWTNWWWHIIPHVKQYYPAQCFIRVIKIFHNLLYEVLTQIRMNRQRMLKNQQLDKKKDFKTV